MSVSTTITEQRACFKAAFTKLARTVSTTGKTGNALKQQLRKNVATIAAKPFTGALLQGIARRPHLDKETWIHVGKHLIELMNAHKILYQQVISARRMDAVSDSGNLTTDG